jgi:DNA-binding HxlR family transcriptional regulator
VGWADRDTRDCSVHRALDVVGDRWSVLILRDVFHGVRRFDDLQRHLGVARDVLARRLDLLVRAGVLTRAPYRRPGARTRQEYRLTVAGRDLRPVLLALLAWGDQHRPGPAGPPARLLHDGCGSPVRLQVVCADGHDVPVTTRLRLSGGD